MFMFWIGFALVIAGFALRLWRKHKAAAIMGPLGCVAYVAAGALEGWPWYWLTIISAMTAATAFFAFMELRARRAVVTP